MPCRWRGVEAVDGSTHLMTEYDDGVPSPLLPLPLPLLPPLDPASSANSSSSSE